MMKRRAIPIALLALAGVVAGAPAPADAAVSDAVIIALNSVKIDRDGSVAGDVVVNDAATQPTLETGYEFSIDRGVEINGNVQADSVDIDRKATVNGSVECNDGSGACSGLDLPVFDTLPVFRTAIPGNGSGANCAPQGDCSVSGTLTLAPGAYGDITIGHNATLELSGGGYDVASVQGGNSSSLRFAGASQLRVAGNVTFGQGANITAAAGLSGQDLVVYVGGLVDFGKTSSAEANFYVAGLFHMDRDSSLIGSVIAFDADFDKNTVLILDSAFNFAPVADPQTVTTSGGSANINLTATDADGDTLQFTLVNGPAAGLVGLPASDAATPTATVAVTYSGGTDGVADQFTFMVDDGKGGTDTAVVNINPSETCVDDNDCDAGFFCDTGAQPPVCTPQPVDGVLAQDAFYETAIDTPIDILTLTAQAPDTVGDLEFQITAEPPAAEGSVSTPPTPASSRSAEVTFTPASGFAGETSFSYEACELPALTNCDGATITVSVQAFTPPAPPVALDQTVTTGADTTVEIDLANPIGSEGDSSEGGREGCGDGNLDPGEQCDDGNMQNGDGCDDQCNIE